MSDLDTELQGYYADQELDESVLEGLVAMQKPKRPRWPFVLGGAISVAAAASAVFVLAVPSMVFMSAEPSPERVTHLRQPVGTTSTTHGEDRIDLSDLERRRPSDGTVVIIKGSKKTMEQVSEGQMDLDRTNRFRNVDAVTELLDKPGDGDQLRSLGDVSGDGWMHRRTTDGRFAEVDGLSGLLDMSRMQQRRATPERTATRTSATSTFGVDTDTGSFTRAHASLTAGQMANNVRPEEFINALRYDYEAPSSGPFAVSNRVVPSPFDDKAHLVRIGLQGERVSVFERKPVHLTFLVDVSGSMSNHDKLPLAQHGMHAMVSSLRDGDTVAMVTYAGRTGIHLEPTTDLAQMHKAIDSLMSGGSTAMGAGIDLAYALAQRTLEPGAINRVVLISDGDTNVGEQDAQKLAKRLRSAADQGISLTTLGVGRNGYRDDVMEQLANKGDGQYHWIGNEKQAQTVLVDHLTGTLQTIARDVKIQVRFDPTVVKSWRLIGYENRRMANKDFRNDSVDAGEVGSNHQVTALYEVELLQPDAPLGSLSLRWEPPGAEGAPAAERAYALGGIAPTTLSDADPDTRVAVVAATFAERLRGRQGPSLATLLDLLPDRPEYRERDGELAEAIRAAQGLGIR